MTKSAQKALRQNLKRRKKNLERKERLKKTIKEFKKLLKDKKIQEAEKYLNLVYKIADKTSKTNIHKNKANRIKSRMAQLLLKTKSKRAVS